MKTSAIRRLLPLMGALALVASGVRGADLDDGTLVVLNKSGASASLLDRRSGREIARVPTGTGPHEVAVSPDGRTAVVADYGAREPGSTLTVIDLPTQRVVRTIDLGIHRRPHGIVYRPDGREVVVTAEDAQTLIIVDVETGTVREAVNTTQRVSHMVVTTAAADRAFVANIGSGSVSVVDLERGALVAVVPTGDGAEGIDIAPDGREVWVSNRGADTVSVIDAATLDVVETLACPDFPIRLKFTPDGRHVLVSNARSGDLAVFDAASRELLARIDMKDAPAGGDRVGDSPVPVGILVTPDGREAYVANTNADFVTVIDTATWTITRRVVAGDEPDGLAYTPLALGAAGAAGVSIADRYRDVAARILSATMAGNDSWRKVEMLCDGIGHRLSGSPQLDEAIRWAADEMRADGQENVRIEPVMVPHWVRGRESLVMVEPRVDAIPMLGLGGSVGTPPEGITAAVVVVEDEAGLEALGRGAEGKIVLFNNAMQPYHPVDGSGYGTAVRFRSKGARLAAAQGAVACLVRSVTANSLRSPHTGAMRYGDAPRRIPAAAIAVEDAALLSRLQARGIPVKVTLEMEARTLDPALSGNVIGELRGREKPEEVVVIGGHIDSWDVGTGAHDDGACCVMAMEAINVLRRQGLVPRRTIRVVLWTNEENGLAGGKQYAKDHADELAQHVAAIEADSGAFPPAGYSVDCADEGRLEIALARMRDLLTLLEPLGATRLESGFSGADVGPMKGAGVVLMGHRVEGSIYFDYHHSHADTLDKVDPTDLSRNVAAMATVAYVLADMEERLGDPE